VACVHWLRHFPALFLLQTFSVYKVRRRFLPCLEVIFYSPGQAELLSRNCVFLLFYRLPLTLSPPDHAVCLFFFNTPVLPQFLSNHVRGRSVADSPPIPPRVYFFLPSLLFGCESSLPAFWFIRTGGSTSRFRALADFAALLYPLLCF